MRFAYTRPDGGVSIVTAAPKPIDLTDEEHRARVIEKSIPPDATDVIELADDWQPPEDRTFRDAWRQLKGEIGVDMPAAREIARKTIRAARPKLFAPLDAEIDKFSAKAITGTLTANDKAAVAAAEAKRQELRDAPADPRIDVAASADELKALLVEAGAAIARA